MDMWIDRLSERVRDVLMVRMWRRVSVVCVHPIDATELRRRQRTRLNRTRCAKVFACRTALEHERDRMSLAMPMSRQLLASESCSMAALAMDAALRIFRRRGRDLYFAAAAGGVARVTGWSIKQALPVQGSFENVAALVDDTHLFVAVENDVSHVWVRVRGITASGKRAVYNADPTLWQFCPVAHKAGWGGGEPPPCSFTSASSMRRRELLRSIDSRDAVSAAVIARVVASSI